jgi:hypothetical protein
MNIPKKLHRGKLEATAMKCQLLRWWADESKGYQMEELATQKIIALRDIRFIEDETPTKLAVIDSIMVKAPELHGDDDSISPPVENPPASTPEVPTVSKASKWENLPAHEASSQN